MKSLQSFPQFRDMLLFLGGLGGVAHETLLTHAERPTLLILFAAMMGLPAFLRADEKGDTKPTIEPPQQPQARLPESSSPRSPSSPDGGLSSEHQDG